MRNKLLLIILTIVIFQSCKLGTSGTWKNDNIDKDKREQISILNDRLFKGIISNDPAAVKSLMAEKLLEKDGANIDKLINQVSSTFKADSYRIMDEYNIHNSTTGISNTLPSGLSGDNDYVIHYLALNKEMYVSFILPNGLDNDLLFTAIYGKYGNEWKLNILQFGQFSSFGKTAPDYYKLAKASYAMSYLIDAVDEITLAKKCLHPANDFFKYNKEKEMNEFFDKVINEANTKYKLPLTLEAIETKPEVFNIYPEMINEGNFPMVCYLSKINLGDTIALKREYEKIKVEVNHIFLGINQDKKYVFYKAFNEIPDGNIKVKTYGFIDNLIK